MPDDIPITPDAPPRLHPVARRSPADLKLQLADVWRQSQPITLDRLQRLDTFLAALSAGAATPQQHEDATTIAHTFAGSLGMFGYPTGTEIARAMEHLLNSTATPHPSQIREYIAALHTLLKL